MSSKESGVTLRQRASSRTHPCLMKCEESSTICEPVENSSRTKLQDVKNEKTGGETGKLDPAQSPVWKQLEPYRGKTKTSGQGGGRRYYEWDFTHGDIEVYNSRGEHLGSMDPTTGEMIKPAVKGRKIGI
jgi:hypothetical protein